MHGFAKHNVMAKDDQRQSIDVANGNSGCLRFASWFFLWGVMLYFSIHVYFIWQPATGSTINSRITDTKVAGFKVFPAVQLYPLEGIAGRAEILNGEFIQPPLLKERINEAIERNYPLSFREEEINAWLAKRLEIKQAGLLASYVEVRGLWVNFKQDEIELVIERKLPGEQTHVTALFMGFERTPKGYLVSRHSCHVGQVRLPGGFGRLLMPAYRNLVSELADELQPYYDHKIFDVRVENGMITIDPRRSEQRL